MHIFIFMVLFHTTGKDNKYVVMGQWWHW